jgi:hypothetical protein
MGVYLNSQTPYCLFKEIYHSPYFVDKSKMLAQLSERIGISEKYICVTRPRRFGKSVMADMIASFFSKGYDAKEIFDTLQFLGKHVIRKTGISMM